MAGGGVFLRPGAKCFRSLFSHLPILVDEFLDLVGSRNLLHLDLDITFTPLSRRIDIEVANLQDSIQKRLADVHAANVIVEDFRGVALDNAFLTDGSLVGYDQLHPEVRREPPRGEPQDRHAAEC